MYCAFLASLRLIVSWFIIVFLSLCFPFPYSFYLGLFIWLLCMQSFLGEGFFARFRLNCFSSLRIVHPWDLAAIASFLSPVVSPFICLVNCLLFSVGCFCLFCFVLFFFCGGLFGVPFRDLNRLLQACKMSCGPGCRGIVLSIFVHCSVAWKPSHSSARYALIPGWPAELAACRAV